MLDFKGDKVDGVIVTASARKGGKHIQLFNNEEGPVATATVWILGLEDGEVAVKNYSENQGMLKWLIDNNVVDKPHREVISGFVTLHICKLTEEYK